MTTTFIGACADHGRAENIEEDPMPTLPATYMHASIRVRLKATRIGCLHGGPRTRLSPATLALKRFLLVNKSPVPFVISDNPGVGYDWFVGFVLRTG
jgi:hypothetical protein